MPALLLPAGLAALAALLLPLLLHLARREARRPVDFAALRWLSARVRPRRSVRFEERLLLAVRLLLLVLLALLLARPVLTAADDRTPWIVATPGIATATLLQAGAPLPSDGASPAPGGVPERRWLAPGFPVAGEAPPPATPQPVASLLRELDMRMPAGAPLTVLVPPVLEGVDAQRPRLSRAVDWRVIDARDDTASARAGTRPGAVGADEADDPAPPPVLAIRHAADRAGDARYLRAAALAWQAEATAGGEAAIDVATIDEAEAVVPARIDALAWLAPGQLPPRVLAWIEAGGTVLVAHDTALPAAVTMAPAWHDGDGRALVQGGTSGRGRVLQWMRPLRPEAMPELLEPDMPHRLRALLAPPPPPARVLAAEHAPLVQAAAWPRPARDLSPWLALAIALLSVVERWLAAGPRRERVA